MTDNGESVDFATGSPARKESIAERMKRGIEERRRAAAQTVQLRHDGVPELTIVCRVPTDGEELAELQQRAEKRAKKAGTSGVWFNRLLIARYCSAIEWMGDTLEGSDGVPWTFASPDLQQQFNAPGAAEAVAHICVSDAYVGVFASQLLEAGGFGDSEAVEVVEDDPTTSR